MDDFIASIDRRRFWSNVAGYLIVLVMFTRGPEMTGFMGQAVWAYIWFYPIYYVGMLIYRWQKEQGKE
jgi:hypothetical protein